MDYKKEYGLYLPETLTKKKSFDVLYSVINNRLETQDLNQVEPFNNNYVIYRAISLLAQNVAQVPLDIYKGENSLPINNEVNQLFIKPNEWMSRFELWEQTIIYLYLQGESFWYLNTNNYGKIQEIYVLNPKYMKHNKSKETGQISSWVFNNKVPMATEEVIFFKLPNPTGLRGLSPIQSVLTEVNTDTNAAKYGDQFFKNFAKVGGYFKTDKESSISKQDMQLVVNKWNAAHQGSDNAYKVGALLGGMEYVETGMTQKDMDYLEGRKDIRDRILVALGVNKTSMGIADDVNRANAKEAMRQIWTLTLKPQLIRIQEKLNAEFFMLYFPGLYCKFNLSGIEELKKDLNTTLESAQKMLLMGYTRNEINERLGLDMPDTNDSDDLLPMNLIPRGTELVEPTKNADKSTKNVDDKILDDPRVKDFIINKKQRRYRTIFLREQKVIERKFLTTIKKYFFQQRKEVLGIVSKSKHIHNINNDLSSFFGDNEDSRLQKVVKPIYIASAEIGINLAKKTLGIKSKELMDMDVVLNKLNKIVGINHTTYNQIKQEIFKASKEGETINQIATRIRGVYNFAEKRSITISKTETASMINNTSFNEYKKEGVPQKEWVGGTRPSHAAVDGEVVGINDVFSNGLMYPGDPSGPPEEVINCTCCVAGVVK